MSLLKSGKVFSNGEQITAGKLNAIIGDATISTTGVDGSTIIVNANDALAVRSGGISTVQLQNYNPNATGDTGVTAAKMAPDSVITSKIKDANVTKAKIEDVADYKVLGNVSGAAAAPAEVAILDEDDMVSNSDTALATQQSIKAYVDSSGGGFTPSTYAGEESVTLPNKLIMKFGSKSVSGDTTGTVSFATDFPGGIVQVQLTYKTNIPLNQDAGLSATSQTVSGFTIQNGTSGTETISWMAIGY